MSGKGTRSEALRWTILQVLIPVCISFSCTPPFVHGIRWRQKSCRQTQFNALHQPVSSGKSGFAEDISHTDHLYSYGADKLRREVAINGISAVDLICWSFLMGQPCACAGTKAHLDHLRGACGKYISGELGACSGCKKNESCTNRTLLMC